MRKLIQDSLFLEVYLIGYRNEGESIVLFTKDANENIYFSGAIDCFEYNQINKTIELLDNCGINHLDFLGWTHTDDDHSIGIDNILEKSYVDKNTLIILPQSIHATKEMCSDRTVNVLNKIDDWIKPQRGKSKYNVKFASDYQVWQYDVYRNPEKQFVFKLISIAPNSTIVRSRDLRNGKKNDYSLAFVLECGGINLVFAGDIENLTINKFEDFYLPEKVEYMKVPHHSSKSSDRLTKYFNPANMIDIVCSTVSRGNSLPDLGIVKKYQAFSTEMYCTGKQNSVDEDNDWGIIKVIFDIVEHTYSVSLEGNASRWN